MKIQHQRERKTMVLCWPLLSIVIGRIKEWLWCYYVLLYLRLKDLKSALCRMMKSVFDSLAVETKATKSNGFPMSGNICWDTRDSSGSLSRDPAWPSTTNEPWPLKRKRCHFRWKMSKDGAVLLQFFLRHLREGARQYDSIRIAHEPLPTACLKTVEI